MTNVFSRYAPFIQDFIYRSGWRRLRAIQAAAGDAIFSTDAHVLLSASTASGKTEAAFFPILTLLSETPPISVGALYIAPLKALINDQFGRLTDLCSEAGIPVWAWHGDVSQSRKRKLIEHPSGVLQITPESLEALLLRKHSAVPALFSNLQFVVIDEIHSLMRGDRGLQTMCLIERLSRLSGTDPRRIGLSATIGDLERAAAFLRGNSTRSVVVPRVASPPVKWRLSMEHYWAASEEKEGSGGLPRNVSDPLPKLPDFPEPSAPAAKDSARAAHSAHAADVPNAPNVEIELPTDAADPRASATDRAPKGADPGLAAIFEHTRGRKCLIFSNSREECEAVTSTLRAYCDRRGESDRFLIHHGNLSTAIRTEAEAAMKDDAEMVSVCTTATLELGIDVGRLERAFQIDAPFTVSGFLQRMGRTGRRGAPPEMWFVMREDEPEPRAMLPATVPWKLLQGIGLVESFRRDRWVEPPNLRRLPFSLLYHQTMTTLASEGEMLPKDLAQRVLTLSPFARIEPADYRTLLVHMIDTDQIERTERGGLIVGLAGERQLSSFKFYAVFQENEEFTVRSRSQELGTIVQPPPAGEKIAIAGRVWLVEEVDVKRHVVWCDEVKGRVPAFFGLCPGDIHTHVLEKMCGVLRSTDAYPYLLPHAERRLMEARSAARRTGMTEHPLLPLGDGLWCLFPWLGTYAFLALERLLKIRCAAALELSHFEVSRPYFMCFRMKSDAPGFFRAAADAVRTLADPMDLVYPTEVPVFEKYDEFVPDALVRKGFAKGVLGVEEMRARVLSWAAGGTFADPRAIEDAMGLSNFGDVPY